MATILDKIVARTVERVRQSRRQVSVADLEGLPGFQQERRDFALALRAERLTIIAESKKASPSQGTIRADYDAARNAQSYEEAGAEALSVLTEPEFFSGSLQDLEAARSVTALPILRKDFVVDPYQVYEARAFGADAVLLIAAVLDRVQLAELHAAATGLGLACLVELYDADELDRLDLDTVRIVGVNNRNLHTFEVDRGHAARVLARVPDRIVRVAESGLRSGEDLAATWAAGIDAVLIGEAFMRAADPGPALARLRTEAQAAAAGRIPGLTRS